MLLNLKWRIWVVPNLMSWVQTYTWHDGRYFISARLSNWEWLDFWYDTQIERDDAFKLVKSAVPRIHVQSNNWVNPSLISLIAAEVEQDWFKPVLKIVTMGWFEEIITYSDESDRDNVYKAIIIAKK